MNAIVDHQAAPIKFAPQETATPAPSPMTRNKNTLLDALFKNLTRFFAFVVFALLAAIMVSLLWGSQDSIREFGIGFLWDPEWDPVNDKYGALVPIFGTLS